VDTTVLLRFAFAFIFVISLMLLLAHFLKKTGLSGVTAPGAKRRLKIVEFLPLDARRRLVLVRRDDREHLIVLGPGGETVVEKDIPVAEGKVVELGERRNV
jgi:flagellar protein FliO/FliZ